MSESEAEVSEPMNGDGKGVVVGYMCRIDWECEIGAASGGSTIYPSAANLRRFHPCVAACGIVEVEVRLRRVIERGTDLP